LYSLCAASGEYPDSRDVSNLKVEEHYFETIEAYIEQSPGWELDVLQLSPGDAGSPAAGCNSR
jgi:hypothetical protein